MGKTKELPQVDESVTQNRKMGFYVELGFKFMAVTNLWRTNPDPLLLGPK